MDDNRPSRSPYSIPPAERARNLANRILFSRWYILFYAVMMGLSLGTVVLSLMAHGNCPSPVFYILEIIVNSCMVLEVGTRWVGFGKQYPLNPLNILDLVLTCFCMVTLLLVFLAPCGTGTRREEILDTLLLSIRNLIQFLRLLSILRRSGHSLLHPPKPIDLSQARAGAAAWELGLDEEHEEARAVGGYGVFEPAARQGGAGEGVYFDAGEVEEQPQRKAVIGKGKGQVGYESGREGLGEEDEAQWDRLG